jgi:hypothetical protein
MANLGAASLLWEAKKSATDRKNEWKSKFTKIGMIIKYLRTFSINGVCVPYAYSMHMRALAASLKKIKNKNFGSRGFEPRPAGRQSRGLTTTLDRKFDKMVSLLY